MRTSIPSIDYPTFAAGEATDTRAGRTFTDPFHQLEADTNEVRVWQQAQATLATTYVTQSGAMEYLRKKVAQYSTERNLVLPQYAAKRWFRIRSLPPGRQEAVVSDTPFGDGGVLFDHRGGRFKPTEFLSWIAPSPDGRILAVGICHDGSEKNVIRLVDIANGELLPGAPEQILMDNWTAGAHWLPDSSGFYFAGLDGPTESFSLEIFLHRRRPTPSTTRLDLTWRHDKEYRAVSVSADGRYALAYEGLMSPVPRSIVDLRDGPTAWRSFLTVDGTVSGHIVGDAYIAVTDIRAPRGRLVSIPLDLAAASGPDRWTELVSESAATLRTMTPAGDSLYLSEFLDTYSRVRRVSPAGRDLGEVKLPGSGAVAEMPFPLMNAVRKTPVEQFLFGFSSLTESMGIYRHSPASAELEAVQEPKVKLANAVVEDYSARSADGTRIPYHVLRLPSIDADQPRPTLIHAYGGFNVLELAQFPGPAAAFVMSGGLFVHAHLRGGGEFGREWWEGGRLGRKQNGYDDLYAVAEDLIERSHTQPSQLAVIGGSNGGLMAAVAALQRPELWAAAVARVPWTDLIGGFRNPYSGWAYRGEYGNDENGEEVDRLASFSPYQLAETASDCPAMYLSAGDTDPRCPAWHARKLAARLQSRAAGRPPVLLHVWENAGHGWATNHEILLEQNTECLAFIFRQLNLAVATGN